MKISFSQFSNKGPRQNNEDSILTKKITDNDYVFAIADGLGGMKEGKTASLLAINYLEKHAENIIKDIKVDFYLLKKWINNVNNIIITKQKEDITFCNMATTLTVAFIIKEHLYYAHMGDTRITIARNNGIMRLTKDHSERQQLFDKGKITRKEFRLYKRKNIINNALGIKENINIDFNQMLIKKNDVFILTSDGVHDILFIRELKNIIDANNSLSNMITNIETEVKNREPTDNYSCIMFIAE